MSIRKILTDWLPRLGGALLQNLDGILVAGIALTLVSFDILGVNITKYRENVTLALFALIAVVLLRMRQNINRNPARLADHVKWKDDVAEIRQTIQNSQEVWLWGAGLTEHIPMLRETLRSGNRDGLKVRILIINPESSALDMLTFRAISPPPEGSSQPAYFEYSQELDRRRKAIANQLLTNMETLRDLAHGLAPAIFDWQATDYLGPYVLYVFNPTRANGEVRVRLAAQGGGDERPTLRISRRDEPLFFSHFVAQFELAWEGSRAASIVGWPR
jgi:hypothetical protein